VLLQEDVELLAEELIAGIEAVVRLARKDNVLPCRVRAVKLVEPKRAVLLADCGVLLKGLDHDFDAGGGEGPLEQVIEVGGDNRLEATRGGEAGDCLVRRGRIVRGLEEPLQDGAEFTASDRADEGVDHRGEFVACQVAVCRVTQGGQDRARARVAAATDRPAPTQRTGCFLTMLSSSRLTITRERTRRRWNDHWVREITLNLAWNGVNSETAAAWVSTLRMVSPGPTASITR
jgi:hypothetical protein